MPVVVPAPFGIPPLRMGGEVFIVGAGFSKAIGQDAMPTLDELGHRVSAPFRKTPSFNLLPAAAQDALLSDRLPGGSLEAWLSHLAVPQPFLTEPERLHNQAIAQELTELLVNEIDLSQMAAMASLAPPWLTRLVALWDRLAATVMTFNYDTLVEHAVKAARMPWHFGQLPTELWNARFLKMHGSLGWWWIPTDRVGNTIYRDDLYGSWGDPVQAPLVGGMVRLVVAPLAAKSDYSRESPPPRRRRPLVQPVLRRARQPPRPSSSLSTRGHGDILAVNRKQASVYVRVERQVIYDRG